MRQNFSNTWNHFLPFLHLHNFLLLWFCIFLSAFHGAVDSSLWVTVWAVAVNAVTNLNLWPNITTFGTVTTSVLCSHHICAAPRREGESRDSGTAWKVPHKMPHDNGIHGAAQACSLWVRATATAHCDVNSLHRDNSDRRVRKMSQDRRVGLVVGPVQRSKMWQFMVHDKCESKQWYFSNK